jgi:hypothetical protein
MTKQEFLSMSYTSDLIIHCTRSIYTYKGELKNTNLCYNSTAPEFYISKNGTTFRIDNIKPILHPLSDLTKEIEHKGEKFVPKLKLLYLGYRELTYNFQLYVLEFGLIQHLVKWHFDIAGLIEKGEAIDINTLEINHYK